MPGYALGNFFLYVFVNAFTPGPGNILALNTATNYGWQKGKPLFFGIFTGYYVVQILCAVFVYCVGAFLPGMLAVMKYIGAAYILWLAYHIAAAKSMVQGMDRTASFWKGFLLQLVNVKIWMFGITALAGYVTMYDTSLGGLLFYEIIIATVGSVATLTWIAVGSALRGFYLRHFRVINILLALTLLECVYSMVKG